MADKTHETLTRTGKQLLETAAEMAAFERGTVYNRFQRTDGQFSAVQSIAQMCRPTDSEYKNISEQDLRQHMKNAAQILATIATEGGKSE